MYRKFDTMMLMPCKIRSLLGDCNILNLDNISTGEQVIFSRTHRNGFLLKGKGPVLSLD